MSKPASASPVTVSTSGVLGYSNSNSSTAITEICVEAGFFLLYHVDGPFSGDTIDLCLKSGTLQHVTGGSGGHQLFSAVWSRHERYKTGIHVIREVKDSTERTALHLLGSGKPNDEPFFKQMIEASFQSAVCCYFNSSLFSSGALIFLSRGRIILFDPTSRSLELALKRGSPVLPGASKPVPVHSLGASSTLQPGGSFHSFHSAKELNAHLLALFPFTKQSGDNDAASRDIDTQLNQFSLTFFQLTGTGTYVSLAPQTPASATAAAAATSKPVPATPALATPTAASVGSPTGAPPVHPITMADNKHSAHHSISATAGAAATPAVTVAGTPSATATPSGGADAFPSPDVPQRMPLVRHPSAQRLQQTDSERLASELLIKHELRRYILQLETTVQQQKAQIEKLTKALAERTPPAVVTPIAAAASIAASGGVATPPIVVTPIIAVPGSEVPLVRSDPDPRTVLENFFSAPAALTGGGVADASTPPAAGTASGASAVNLSSSGTFTPSPTSGFDSPKDM